jgi:hypothetical protein
MRLLICGDRNWTNKELILDVVRAIRPKPKVIISGGAQGADKLAAEVAIELKIPLQEFLAKWEQFGKAAGPIRNQTMLREGQPTLVIAFHDDIKNSKGTAHMLYIAKYNKIKTRLYTTKGLVND